MSNIHYTLDPHDRILSVNNAWDSFAEQNSSNEVKGDVIVGRHLWEFIADESTRQLYREILARARNGKKVQFTLRCDSADCRRQLEMNVEGDTTGRVEFRVRTISEEVRPPQALLDPVQKRNTELVRICSWCKKVNVHDHWMEVEHAVEELGLFSRTELPELTHGICEACFDYVTSVIDN